MRFDPRFCPNATRVLGLDAITYGGDYNPEQWPREIWHEDVELMVRAGVNMVSVGIWSWAKLEPREGEFDFEWLDYLLDLLHKGGIRVDLATPTAAPPAWFYKNYPQARVVTRDGTVLTNASRGMAAPSSPDYQRACANVTRALAQRYGNHPAVAMWHVHNEYGAPVSDSYDNASRDAWRIWLAQRYLTLDGVNEAWGTSFWGQTYYEWDEIPVPAISATVTNPSMRLDYARFSSDAVLGCYLQERDIIKEHSAAPVTTNFMALNCPSMDLWAWAQEVDIVSNDYYLEAADPRGHIKLALDSDLTRSIARGKPWILLEHSTSGVNWQDRNVAKNPKEMARNSLSSVARGADGIMFFQWRAARFGAEKFHSAMLPHAGVRSRVFREVCDLGAALGELSQAGVAGSSVPAEVALLWDWESFWAQDLEWRPSIDAQHRERTLAFYTQLWEDKVTVDFAHPEQDLSAYKLVIAPASYLLTDAGAANLADYVRGGGKLAVSFFSGVVNENDTVRHGGLGAALEDVLGLRIDEFLPLRSGDSYTLLAEGKLADACAASVDARIVGGKLRGDVWADDLDVQTAEIMARYLDGPKPDGAAITRNLLGQGAAWYVSSRLVGADLAAFLDAVYLDAGVSPRRDLPADFEIVTRASRDESGDRFTFLINHTEQVVDYVSGTIVENLIPGGEQASAAVAVPPGEVWVVRERA
ncbi:beta-galactosidase [Timonella senegalensis]|uniref:beta-galactosidase n=1 Tax=Timonella senegalensis TaxID=1465825 RepID=UPI002FDD8B6F